MVPWEPNDIKNGNMKKSIPEARLSISIMTLSSQGERDLSLEEPGEAEVGVSGTPE